MRIAVATSALALALLACSGPQKGGRVESTPVEMLPPLSFPLLDGGEWEAASFRGRVLVVDVWASWCEPCRAGFAKLNQLAERRPELAMVAISIDEEAAAVRAFLAEVKVELPVAHDAVQSVTRAPLLVKSIPAILVVDAQGGVRHRVEEPTERDYTRLFEVIESLR